MINICFLRDITTQSIDVVNVTHELIQLKGQKKQ